MPDRARWAGDYELEPSNEMRDKKPMASESPQIPYRRAFWMLWVASTLARLLVAGQFGLSIDESHYVLYARHLAWGYFDHPPVVGFLGALTSLLGHSVFFYRLGPVVCSAASILLLRRLALALYRDERVALGAQVLLLFMPMGHLIAVALLPDATLNVFWCGAMLAAWRALQGGRWRDWIVMGLLFGGAMLSKYHGVLIPLCLGAYVLASPAQRHWLRSPKPYAAGLLGALVFLPNIVWNARHEWISYAFQLAHGHGRHAGLKLSKILVAFGGQFAAASPVIFGLLVAGFIVLVRTRPVREADRFVLWTSLPVFVFFLFMGMRGAILPHWTYVGWWTGSIGLSAVAWSAINDAGDERRAMRWRRWTRAGVISSSVLILLMYGALLLPVAQPAYRWAGRMSEHLHARFPSIPVLGPFRPAYDPTNDLYGWDQIAREVEEIRKTMPHPEKTFVFCHLFYTVSQLTVFLDPETPSTTLGTRVNQYHLWFDPAEHVGWDALLVDEDRLPDARRYGPLFRDVDPEPARITVNRRGEIAHSIRVYRYYGFDGHRQ